MRELDEFWIFDFVGTETRNEGGLRKIGCCGWKVEQKEETSPADLYNSETDGPGISPGGRLILRSTSGPDKSE
jgi:hypothetical protein